MSMPRSSRDWKAVRRNLDAGLCANNDGRPVAPPSKVVCRECQDMIEAKLRELLARLEQSSIEESKP